MRKVCLIILFAVSFSLVATAEMETWKLKGKDGESFEAELIGVDGSTVNFKNADGTTRDVPLSSFTRKMQASITGGSVKKAGSKKSEEAGEEDEPVGAEIGVYECAKFKAVFCKPAVLVYFKDNAGEIMPNRPLKIMPYVGYKGKPRERTLESFREEPVYKDGKVVYKMTRVDEVVMDVYFEAKGNQIKTWYTLKDGDYVSKSQPSVYSHCILFAKVGKYNNDDKKYYDSALFPEGMTLDELKKSYYDTDVEVTYFKGKSVFPYDKSVKKADKLGGASKMEVKGKMFAPRKISVTGPATKGNAWLIFTNYGGQSPFYGYKFSLERTDATKLAPAECMILQID